MAPTVKKKRFWNLTNKFLAASGITLITCASFASWAVKSTEEKILSPYVCNIINNESPRLHAPIEARLGNIENDTKIVRYIVQSMVPQEKIDSAVRAAHDSTFKVR